MIILGPTAFHVNFSPSLRIFSKCIILYTITLTSNAFIGNHYFIFNLYFNFWHQ